MPSSPVDDSADRQWIGNFVLFLASLCAATLAIQIQAAVVGYQLYEITHDPLSLGAIGLAEALPYISLAPVGGHVADVFDRKRVALGAFAVMAVVAGALLTLTRWRAALPSTTLRFGIYGAIVLGGAARSFLQPARIALSARIVPRAFYQRAIAWRVGLFQLTAVLGPALGGELLGRTGGVGAYLTSCVLLGVAAATMAAVRSPREEERKERPPFFASIREGAGVLFREPVLLPAVIMDLFAVLFGGVTALLPVFANEILKVGAVGFGHLRAAPAAGALLASGWLALRPPLKRSGRALLVAVAGFGICMIAFALSRSYALSLFLLAASGALDMVSVMVRSTLLQLRIPESMLGRVSSLNQIFIGSSNEIGAFESGVAARVLGTVPSVIMGGCITLSVVSLVAWRAPALRKLGPLA